MSWTLYVTSYRRRRVIAGRPRINSATLAGSGTAEVSFVGWASPATMNLIMPERRWAVPTLHIHPIRRRLVA